MTHLKSLLFALLFLFSISSPSIAQEDISSSLSTANKLYKDEHFRNAIPYYEEVLKQQPENVEALFKSGVCYLNRFSKEKALENILKAFEKDSSVNKHIRYWMGRAYHLNYKFDEALLSYSIYKSSLRKKDQRSDDLRLHLEQSAEAKKQSESPQNYMVQNMGNHVNSSFSDHSPVISNDGQTIYFTSRRETSEDALEEMDGEPFEDIFYSKKTDSVTWSKPESIHLNTTGHDASCQIFENDTKMLIYKFHKGGDIYICTKEGDKWSEPVPFANINTKRFESSAFITADGNTAYFSTNKYKKNDDLDIYYISKDESGNWSKIKELKGNINTKFDEEAPFLTPDGKTMYFSSRGQNNMGGFDIFKSTVDENGVWSEPVNLGAPINTPDDDVYYYLSANGKRGYLASYRSDGMGEKDIYEIIPIKGINIQGLVVEDVTGNKVDSLTVLLTPIGTTNAAVSDISKNGGSYGVKVQSNSKYKIAVMKGADTLKTEIIEVPVSDDDNNVLTRNITIPPSAKPVDTSVVAADTTRSKSLTHKYVFRDYTFPEGKSSLSDETKHELDIAIEILKKNPDAEVSINGNDKSSQKLAEERAKAVNNYFLSNGIDPNRIKSVKGKKSTSSGVASRSVSTDVKLKSGLSLGVDPKLIPSYTVGSTFILRNVYFVTAKYELKPEGKAELDILKNILTENPTVKIELAGHTDDIGNDEYNQKLSESRAKAAMDYLVKKGIDASRLSYKGYGESMPYVTNDSDFNRTLNRRTEAKITAR